VEQLQNFIDPVSSVLWGWLAILLSVPSALGRSCPWPIDYLRSIGPPDVTCCSHTDCRSCVVLGIRQESATLTEPTATPQPSRT
jgi:hypothetical protein